jgi:crotonobetainyl-CoA:carnitine CoA-transferase CaiB-like acyl-CoA transferase
VFEAKNTGAHAVELNLEPSEGADLFDALVSGVTVPALSAWKVT